MVGGQQWWWRCGAGRGGQGWRGVAELPYNNAPTHPLRHPPSAPSMTTARFLHLWWVSGGLIGIVALTGYTGVVWWPMQVTMDDMFDMFGAMGVDEPPMFAPPFDGVEGEWIPRELFRGNKSFGGFVCNCGKTWVSAHAQKVYRQQCKTCKTGYLPTVMWQNDNRSRKSVGLVEVSDRLKGHHESSLCEACKRGSCTAPGGVNT